mgnify:CR=1 FL=1
MLARRLAGRLAGRLLSAVRGDGFVRCLSHKIDGLNRHAESWDSQTAAEGSLLGRYTALVDSGTLKPDLQQATCIRRLDRLFMELSAYSGAVDAYQEKLAAYQVGVRRAAAKHLAEHVRCRAQNFPGALRVSTGCRSTLSKRHVTKGPGWLLVLLYRVYGLASPQYHGTPDTLVHNHHLRACRKHGRSGGKRPTSWKGGGFLLRPLISMRVSMRSSQNGTMRVG